IAIYLFYFLINSFIGSCQNCPIPTSINLHSNFGYVEAYFGGGNLSIAEYGSIGFTPGTGNTAGPNSSVSYVFSGQTIGYFAAGTTIQFYLRSRCAGQYFSPNVGPINFTIPNCIPAVTYNTPGIPMPISLYYNNVNSSLYNLCQINPGPEKRILYNCNKTANYTIEIGHNNIGNNMLSMGMKNFSGTCIPNSYVCPPCYSCYSPVIYNNIQLLKDSTYEFIIDVSDTAITTNIDFLIKCPGPQNIIANNIQSNSIDFSWSCNCADTVVVEYGPPGFVPGTNSAPGINGNIITTTLSEITVSGLQVFTTYDFYFRSSCGNFYSDNVSISKKTAKDCAQAQLITCGDYLQFHYAGDNAVPGTWLSNACSSMVADADEKLFQFIPSQTGMYEIFVYQLTSNWYNPLFKVGYYFKHDSLSCNENSWTCIGNVASQLFSFTPQTFSFGPLTAGEKYYLMADGVTWTYKYFTYNARLVCENVCNGPTLWSASAITLTSADINVPCSNCFTNGKLEYGIAGFTPGVDSLPGTGGTLIDSVVFSYNNPWSTLQTYNLTGLNPGESYDVYARSDCSDSGEGFSSNSGPVSFTTCSLTPTGLITNVQGNTICEGDSITITLTGGALAPGGYFQWYSGFCNSNLIGTGISITVAPVSNTNYYVRAVAPCGITPCIGITIYVSSPVPSVSGSLLFCEEGSTVVSVNGNFTSYLWSTGDTTQTISIDSSGLYSIYATNALGCSGLEFVYAIEIPNPEPILIGNLFLCPGGTLTLDPGSGFENYFWSTGDSLQLLTINTPGAYAVTVSNNFGCTGSDSINIIGLQNPLVSIYASGPVSICSGDSVKLITNSGLTGWQWLNNNIPIINSTSSEYWAKTEGVYSCTGFDSFECFDTSNYISVQTPCIPLGSNQNRSQSNDETDFFATILENSGNGKCKVLINCLESRKVEFLVFDLTGKYVSFQSISDGDIYYLQIEKNGMFFLQIKCGNEMMVEKFVRQY
nr:hypothetical protein [Chitinophagaceae bacterium]